MKRLILVHGDKGGTGKSHVAHLTTAAFRSAGHPLLLVDGDAKNAGLHRAYNGKPDDVLRINARQAHGSDQLLEAFLEAETDVLIDLPAGGSDLTARFLGGGTAEGSVDLGPLLEEVGARLVILFVIDQGRDGLVALDDEFKSISTELADWIIVRNHRLEDTPFTRFETWAARADLTGVKVVDMPRLDRRVVEALVDAKANLIELDHLESASALLKIRGRAALRIWSETLKGAGLLDA